jgi:hypothetical protein
MQCLSIVKTTKKPASEVLSARCVPEQKEPEAGYRDYYDSIGSRTQILGYTGWISFVNFMGRGLVGQSYPPPKTYSVAEEPSCVLPPRYGFVPAYSCVILPLADAL